MEPTVAVLTVTTTWYCRPAVTATFCDRSLSPASWRAQPFPFVGQSASLSQAQPAPAVQEERSASKVPFNARSAPGTATEFAPWTASFAAGDVVPMPTLPAASIVNLARPPVSRSKAKRSFVPRVAAAPKELPPCKKVPLPPPEMEPETTRSPVTVTVPESSMKTSPIASPSGSKVKRLAPVS